MPRVRRLEQGLVAELLGLVADRLGIDRLTFYKWTGIAIVSFLAVIVLVFGVVLGDIRVTVLMLAVLGLVIPVIHPGRISLLAIRGALFGALVVISAWFIWFLKDNP